MPDTPTIEKILRSAHLLIIQRGFHGFSFAGIAIEVGIRKASIHHYFPTKISLVSTLVANYRRDAIAGLQMLRERHPDPAAALNAYIDYWARCVTSDTDPFCLCALLAAEAPSLPPGIAAEVRGHFQAVAAWFAAVLGQAKGGGSLAVGDAVEVEAEALVATVHGALLSARAYANPGVVRAVMSTHLERLQPAP